jgi:hypothetical protein
MKNDKSDHTQYIIIYSLLDQFLIKITLKLIRDPLTRKMDLRNKNRNSKYANMLPQHLDLHATNHWGCLYRSVQSCTNICVCVCVCCNYKCGCLEMNATYFPHVWHLVQIYYCILLALKVLVLVFCACTNKFVHAPSIIDQNLDQGSNFTSKIKVLGIA